MIRILTASPTPSRRWSHTPVLAATIACAAFTITQAASGQEMTMPGLTEAETITWTKLTNQPTFNTDTPLLLTDGRVIVHSYSNPSANGNTWWTLTPDINGSYLNGTWAQVASMPSNYKPLYFASAVLPSGNVIVEGGEYNNLQQVETNLGAYYNAAANTWTNVNPPSGWSNIGDSPGTVKNDGTFMMGQGGFSSTKQVLLNESNLTWTSTNATGKADTFVEEGFGLLPNGKFMIIDTQHIPNSEIYDPATNAWTSAGNTPVTLPDAGSEEVGPQMQRPDGNMVAFGGTPHTALFNFATSTWAAGPNYPNNNDSADGPCVIFPDSNILLPASPGVFQGHITFFVFDGTTFTQAPGTQSSGSLQSWQTRMIMLPSGQALYVTADGNTKDVEIATSNGRPQNAWRPAIRRVPATLTRGTTVTIQGRQFNGLSIGSDYGDDATNGTNYPLARITNNATHHVFYGKTHNHSTMAIATGTTPVSTMFDVPANAETGASMIEVIANGIASRPVAVTVN